MKSERQKAIESAVKDLVERADYNRMGEIDIFGEIITAACIENAIKRVCENIAKILTMSNFDFLHE